MIRNAKEKDLNEIYEISNEQLGFNYIKKDSIKHLINNNFAIILIFEENKEILGFSLFEIIDNDRLKLELKTLYKKLDKKIKNSNNFGFLNIVAVKEKSKGKGIGSLLTLETIDKVKQQNIKYTFSLAWQNKTKINIGNILLRSGFKQLQKIENYYYEDSIAKKYSCPTCGEPPCKCSAIVYIYEEKTKL